MSIGLSKRFKLLLSLLLVFSLLPWATPSFGIVSAALVENVYAFGEGDHGRLGISDSDLSDQLVPAVVGQLTGLDILDVSAGFDYTLILTTDGEVYSFGNGANGRLGHGDTLSQMLPKKIEALEGEFIVAISAGEGAYTNAQAHSLVLTNDGRVFAFGRGASGQLGLGTNADVLTPTEITGVGFVRAISAGGLHSLLLTSGGDVYSFGNSSNGQLGRDDSDTAYNLPGLIEDLWDVVAISAGNNFSLALTGDENENDAVDIDADVYAFGAGSLGQLGLGTDTSSTAIPTVISGLSGHDVAAISAGSDYGLALTRNGDVYSFGDNFAGRLGHNDFVSRNAPQKIMALDDVNVTAISAGGHSIVLTDEGEAYSFGSGTNGQLGTGVQNEKKVPTKVVGLSNVTKISAGFYHSVLQGSVDDSMTYSAQLSVSNSVNFYPLLSGYATSLAQTVAITNTGTGDITGLRVTLGGTNPNSFEFTSSGPSPVITPGSSTSFYVRPKLGLAAGDYEANVTVAANNGISQTFAIRVTITAEPTYSIDVTPSELIFSPQAEGYGAQSDTNVTVARTGTGDIRNMSVTFEGDDPNSFIMGSFATGEIFLNTNIKSFNIKLRPKQGLTLGTYDAIVRITGDNGVDESVSLSFTVNSPPRLTDQPDSITVDEGSQAVFAASAEGTGPLTYQWQVNSGSGYVNLLDEMSASLTIPNVTKDMSGHQYRVVVSGGLSPAATSTAATLTVNAIPAKPIISGVVASDRQIRVNWAEVYGTTGYNIYVGTSPGIYDVPDVVDNSVNSYDITGLTNGTEYYIAVSAINGALESPLSNEVSEIPLTVPGAPSNIRAVAGNGQATVSFDIPVDDGGNTIVGYEVISTPGNIEVTGSSSPIIVTGLSNGVGYSFSVKAINGAGASASSAASNVVVPRMPPTHVDSGNYIPPASTVNMDILVNGISQSIGLATITEKDGTTSVTLVVDEQKLQDKIQSEGKGAIVTIPVMLDSDEVIVNFNGSIVQFMVSRDATLLIQTKQGTYTLPASLIDLDSLSDLIGSSAELGDLKMEIKLSTPTDHQLKLMEAASKNKLFILLAPAVNYSISINYLGKKYEIKEFTSYVERTIAIPDNLNPESITTGVVVGEDGTVRHVPTYIQKRNGTNHVILNSLTNSLYALASYPANFEDLSGHWAEEAVHDMASRLILQGTLSGLFLPNDEITRAEFAAIIVRALGLDKGYEDNPFSDVNGSNPYHGVITTAYFYGLLSGYADGTFRPDGLISREEAMSVVARAMVVADLPAMPDAEQVEAALSLYKDADAVSTWARDSVAGNLLSGIVNGRSDGNLAPGATMTRAEAVVIVRRLLQYANLIE